jgi:hypothetical protein
MEPVYHIIDVDPNFPHAWLIGNVTQNECGAYWARFTTGEMNAGGSPMKESVAAIDLDELVAMIRKRRPNALLCNVA